MELFDLQSLKVYFTIKNVLMVNEVKRRKKEKKITDNAICYRIENNHWME